jgi:hypothetical protein
LREPKPYTGCSALEEKEEEEEERRRRSLENSLKLEKHFSLKRGQCLDDQSQNAFQVQLYYKHCEIIFSLSDASLHLREYYFI